MIILCGKEIDEKYISEQFEFIIDHPFLKDDEAYSFNRQFLKELGLKGDSVGWCTVKNPNTEKINAIFDKAKAEKVKVRGEYTLSLTPDYESEWYDIEGCNISSASDLTENRTFTCGGENYYLSEIKAYAMPKNIVFTNNTVGEFAVFREDAVKFIQSKGFSGIDFLWMPDCGRYAAPNFYQAFPVKFVNRCYTSNMSFGLYDLKAQDFDGTTEVSRIIFQNCKRLHLDLPLAVDKKELPETDFAGICPKHTINNRLLIRKECRDLLIEAGLAKAEHFSPVIVTDKLNIQKAKPLMLLETAEYKSVPQFVRFQIQEEFEKHILKKKPQRMATEKLALQTLKAAKKESPDNYNKKAGVKALADIPDERLAPYCKIADGAVLSDEYNFLSIREMLEETKEFAAEQSLENTDTVDEKAIVFAKAADGEYVLLLPDGRAVRYQQGEIGFSESWDNLHTFFVDTIQI